MTKQIHVYYVTPCAYVRIVYYWNIDRLNRYSTLGKALDSSTGSQAEYVLMSTHRLANQILDEYYGQRKQEN